MIFDAIVRRFRRRFEEYPPDHPIRRSRELVTEARLRVWRSERIIRDVEAGHHAETGTIADLIFPSTQRKDRP